MCTFSEHLGLSVMIHAWNRFRLVLWEDLARQAGSALFKGNKVWVRGTIGLNSYQPPNGPIRETVQVRGTRRLPVRPGNESIHPCPAQVTVSEIFLVD